MENMNETKNSEMCDVKAKLETIHNDIKRLSEKSNQEYLDNLLSDFKKDFLNSISNYVVEDLEKNLERGMLDPCHMRDTCKSRFQKFLTGNVELIKCDSVPKEKIEEKKSELNEIRNSAPFDKCEICFSEVDSLFNKQLSLINSLHIYNDHEEKKSEISKINEEFIAKNVLEPLSNKQRLQIIKSLSSKTRTFSALSELTGLRGGNLLFHLQKLLESGIILQRHERGDYMITQKGFSLLLLLADCQKFIENEK
jgi:DNA-binding transcriptional ArsR family regulator